MGWGGVGWGGVGRWGGVGEWGGVGGGEGKLADLPAAVACSSALARAVSRCLPPLTHSRKGELDGFSPSSLEATDAVSEPTHADRSALQARTMRERRSELSASSIAVCDLFFTTSPITATGIASSDRPRPRTLVSPTVTVTPSSHEGISQLATLSWKLCSALAVFSRAELAFPLASTRRPGLSSASFSLASAMATMGAATPASFAASMAGFSLAGSANIPGKGYTARSWSSAAFRAMPAGEISSACSDSLRNLSAWARCLFSSPMTSTLSFCSAAAMTGPATPAAFAASICAFSLDVPSASVVLCIRLGITAFSFASASFLTLASKRAFCLKMFVTLGAAVSRVLPFR